MKNQSIVGVDVGGTKISIGRIVEGNIVAETSFPTHAHRGEDEIIQDIIRGIEKVIEPNTIAIGIGSPGLVDEELGMVYDVSNIPSWKEVRLRDKIEAHFNRIVQISNDANCFVMGEKIFGKGKKYRNFVGITLGTGVGGGIIIDHKLYPGTLMAGEFCGIPYLDKNYDFYCGSKFFTEKHGITGFEASQRILSGDGSAQQIFDEYGEHLGNLFKTIILILNPEAIIIGGSIAKSYALFENSLKSSLNDFALNRVIDRLNIEVSEIDSIAVIGAAALVYNHKRFVEVI